jgi:Protein kinase domain
MPEVMKTVGRYEILREVGRGGMAMVYLARQTDLDRFVALKELGAFHASDPSFAQRFLRESRVAGSLSHPNIVTVHDYFADGGVPFIAMEYLERGSLRPFVRGVSVPEIGGILEGLLAGLAGAEQHGVVHRDLKPENLLVTTEGRVKIADFGIAKATKDLQTAANLTVPGTTVGTPNYIAPEQAMGRAVGPWTDLYSVGVIAFELFVGRTPFGDTSDPMGVVLRQVNEAIPPVTSLVPGADPGLAAWVDWLVSKDPLARPQSALEAWDALEERLIEVAGPRWRREALLLDPAQRAVLTIGPVTPPALDAPRGPLTRAEIDAFPATLAMLPVTAAPQRPLPGPPEREAPPAARRTRSSWRAVAVFAVAVLALAAAALGGRGAIMPAEQTPVRATQPGALAQQAATEYAMANSYDTVAASLKEEATSPSTPAARALLVEVRNLARAYRGAADAATRGDVARHDAALAEAVRTRSAVDRALAEVVPPQPQGAAPRPAAPSTHPQPVPDSGEDDDSVSDDPSDEEPED